MFIALLYALFFLRLSSIFQWDIQKKHGFDYDETVEYK